MGLPKKAPLPVCSAFVRNVTTENQFLSDVFHTTWLANGQGCLFWQQDFQERERYRSCISSR